MTRILSTALALTAPTVLLAHEAGGTPHLHPHGGEILLALLALVVVLVIWRFRRP